MRWLHFILSHSIFSALCAAALCFQTLCLLSVPGAEILYLFIFFATLCSYNFYWLISKYSFGKPASAFRFIKSNLTYTLLFLVAGVGMLLCLYYLPHLYIYVALAIVSTVLYSLPLWPFSFAHYFRKAGVLKTLLLAFTWAYVTVIIPAYPVLFTETRAVMTLFVARFSFMLMLCSIFDKRDIKVDKLHALQSLATNVSMGTLKAIMVIAFFVYIVAGFFLRYQLKDSAQTLAFLVTGLVVWWVYRLSFKEQGYIFYYFIVDGLMLFAAGATLVASLV